MIFKELLNKQNSELIISLKRILIFGRKPGDNNKSGDVNCKITLYQNGFQVDNGPFREYNTPENQEFMKDLNKGYFCVKL